jgi:hypothetical protein
LIFQKSKSASTKRRSNLAALGSSLLDVALEEAIEAVDGLIFNGRTLNAAKANERKPTTQVGAPVTVHGAKNAWGNVWE